MKNFKFRLMALLVVALLAAFTPPPVRAEGYFYQGNRGFSVSFSLIGGPSSIYLYARRPQNYSSASRECIFGGNLQRVWPTQDAISLGSGLTISTIVPHKIGPKTLTLPPGLYRIYIAPLIAIGISALFPPTKTPQALHLSRCLGNRKRAGNSHRRLR